MSVRQLSPALQKRAEAELNEDPTRTSSDIAALQQWLASQPHLRSVEPTEQWLVAFLRGCKFNLERSKEKLEMYYTMRTQAPSLFSERDPLSPRIQDLLKLGIFLPLRSCPDDGTRVCLFRLGQHDTSRFKLSDLIKLSFMISEILMLEDDHFVVSGEEFVLDMKGVGLSVLAQFTPGLARKVLTCVQKALPVRQRANHILNTPPGFEVGYAIFRSFLSDKLKKRVRVHNLDYDALHRCIPKCYLPVEYGGEDGTVQDLIEHWKTKVEGYRCWFLQQEVQKSAERQRPDKPKIKEKVFNIESTDPEVSFRKLNLD